MDTPNRPPRPPAGYSDDIRRAAEELLRRGRNGVGMTASTARYRQLELAQLLHTIARAITDDDPLPDDLLRHAGNLAQHILNYPPAEAEGPDHSLHPAGPQSDDGASQP